MRIMHVLNHTHRLNGHVHAVVDVACEQSRLGHNVCIASGGGDFDDVLTANDVAIRHLPHERRMPAILRSIIMLGRFLKEWRPDVVHAHTMDSAVLAYLVCKLTGTPMVTTVHDEFETGAALMGLGARVIAVSDAVGKSMRDRGISEQKLRVVLRGTIGAARYAGHDRVAADLRHPNIVFVGGLHPRKGLPYLLEAFGEILVLHPDAWLYVVGAGPMEGYYRRMAVELRCAGNSVFVGSLDDPRPYMLAADVFVLPSLSDPAPLVISEAREAGCAVVGTDVGGIPQLLEFGEAGMLVPPQEPQVLARVLAELLGNRQALDSWRTRSQYHIESMSVERVARETVSVYQSIGGGEASPGL